MNRCGRTVAFLYRGLAALTLLSAVGCGEEELSDDFYGAVDLTPFYADGATLANPRAAIPDAINPVKAWYKGRRAEYYDFGVVAHRKKRNAAGATINEPDIAFVNPMYFFYDQAGNPMFSKPLYDGQRTGTFFMRGGENMLSPTPREPNAANQAEVSAHYATPYSQRPRRPFVDAWRGNDDYQRPIIDKLADDATYTGLWEVVIARAKGGYTPDAIKSWKTLKSAVDDGKFALTRTLKAINCPVIEEKTAVTPSAVAVRQGGEPYMLVQPRVEVWYRTKLGFCHMANGFETIGEVNVVGGKEVDPRESPDNITLFKADEIADRGIETFDVVKYQVGNEKQSVWVLEAKVMKIYSPKITVARGGILSNSTVRVTGDDIITALPKHLPWDQPGFSPIVWLHEVDVPQAPAYEPGSFKSLEDVDPVKIGARDAATAAWTKNMPVIGVSQACVNDGQCGFGGQTCNKFPDIDVATFDAPPGKNLADLTLEREGGPRCDLPTVGYGEYCAPGIGRCEQFVATNDNNDKLLTALKAGSAGPNFTIHADAAKVIADMAATPDAKNAAMARAKWYADRGYDKDLSGRGYNCHPPTGGYCYIRCDGAAAPGTIEVKTKMLTVNDPRRPGITKDEPARFTSDARCGGLELMGYRCLSNRPNKQRICLRECTTRDTQQFNNALCSYPLNEAEKPYKFSDGQIDTPGLAGQSCVALANATACMWNPDFEPRDPGQTLR